MKQIIIHVGPHLSGKSYNIRKNAIQGIIIEEQTLNETIKRLNRELKNPYNLFQIELPFVSKLAREQIYKSIKRSGITCDLLIYLYHPPLEVLLERNKRKLIPYKEKIIKKQFYNMQYPYEIERDKIVHIGYNEYPDIDLNNITPTLWHLSNQNKGGDTNDILVSRSKYVESVHSMDVDNSNNINTLRSCQFPSVENLKKPPYTYFRLLFRIRREISNRSRGDFFKWLKRKAKQTERIIQ